MYKETLDGTLAVCVGICKALMNTHTLGESARNTSAVLSAFPWMDRKSISEIRYQADRLTRSMMMEEPRMYPTRIVRGCPEIMKAFNRAYKRRWVKTKGKYVTDSMYANRRRSVPVLFYLVSKHQLPQEAHKDLQGTVLVDRYWRAVLKDDPDELKKVGAYIKANDVKTVQWAMGEPHWLITRVNCRHYLITMPTSVVLSSTLAVLNQTYQKRPSGIHRPITDPERYAVFKRLQSAIYRRCVAIVRRRP